MFPLFSAFLLFLIAGLAYVTTTCGRRGKYLPDGPPTLPIIGNLHQIPMQRGYLKFVEWAETYGGMYSIKLASTTAIVLTDRALVKELMDRKSAISSDRPAVYVMSEMVYERDSLLLMDASDRRWRESRRILHQHLMATVVERNYTPLINAEAVQLIHDMCVVPNKFLQHPRRFANSLIMSITYGIRTPHCEIAHMQKIDKILHNTTTLFQPGSMPPIDIFPLLRFLPERLWGNWVTKANIAKNGMKELYASYLQHVKQRRQVQGSKASLTDSLLDQQEKLGWNWHQIAFLCGAMMEAGSDTSSSALTILIHLLAKYPDVAKRAQKQIDDVVGIERSPEWRDFEKLPLVNAIIKESMRLRPVVPILFPHKINEDVWLQDKLLPKGSTIIINAYGIHHDEKRFPNPTAFDPGHFEGMTALASEYASFANQEERDHYAYGVGRRVCAGMHFAERAIFTATAKMLWAFDISQSKDEHGNSIELDISSETGYADGITAAPLPFTCDIRPRSEQHRATIIREFAEAERTVFTNYEVPAQ